MKKKNVTIIYKPAPAEVVVICAYCKTEQRIDYEKFENGESLEVLDRQK